MRARSCARRRRRLRRARLPSKASRATVAPCESYIAYTRRPCTCTPVRTASRADSNKRGERRTSLQILSIAVCLSGWLSVRKSARARYGMKCLLHSHSLFVLLSLAFSSLPPSTHSFSLSFVFSLSLSLSHSFFQSLLSFPREFDHLANPVVARQARQTEAFRAIPDGAFIFPPLALPLDLLLLISLLSFLSDRSLSFFLLSCSDKIYRLPCRPRNFSASTKRAAVCRAICENYTILKAIPSNYNILWRLRVWKMVSSLAASWTRRIILFNTGLH